MGEAQGYFNLAEDNKIASAVDLARQQKAPKTIDGEKVMKYSQAAYDGGNALRSTWKIGSLFLTEEKLAFFQSSNRIFETPLEAIVDIEIINRAWIPGKIVEQIRLTRERKGLKRKFYFSIKKIHPWKDEIERLIKQKTEDRGHPEGQAYGAGRTENPPTVNLQRTDRRPSSAKATEGRQKTENPPTVNVRRTGGGHSEGQACGAGITEKRRQITEKRIKNKRQRTQDRLLTYPKASEGRQKVENIEKADEVEGHKERPLAIYPPHR